MFLADDRQLRDITFWLLGSLGGATWGKVCGDRAVRRCCSLSAMPFIARGLDLIVLGEAEAFHMGVAVERLKRIAIVLVAAATGAAVSVAASSASSASSCRICCAWSSARAIACCCRLRFASARSCCCCADTFARIVAAPAELPIGIVTAAIGAPFFLSLLLRQTGGQPDDASSRRSGISGARGRQDACLTMYRSPWRPARPSRWSARTAPASRRCCACSAGEISPE